MMRVLVVAGLAVSSTAVAEDSSGFRLSAAPTFARLDRTTRYHHDESPTFPDLIERMDGFGGGGQLEVARAWKLTSAVDLGGVARVSLLHLDVDVTENEMTRGNQLTIRSMRLGPQLTIRSEPFYVRSDLAIGRLSTGSVSGTYRMHSAGLLGLVEVGAEVGYRHRFRPGLSGQLGLGASTSFVRSDETADHGTYLDRSRVILVATTASLIFH